MVGDSKRFLGFRIRSGEGSMTRMDGFRDLVLTKMEIGCG